MKLKDKRGAAGIPGKGLPGVPGKLFSRAKIKLMVIIFLVIIILESIGGFWFLFIATFLIGLFGFLHLFSPAALDKAILGGVPIVLAVFSLPELIGGGGFGDIIGSIPFINIFTPHNGWASIGRYIILAGVLFYYMHFLRTDVKAKYGEIGEGAGKVAGERLYGWRFGIGRVIAWILLVAAVYTLENYSSLIGFSFPTEYGLFLIALLLLGAGIVLIIRQGFFSKVLGLVSLVLAVSSLQVFVPSADIIFGNAIMEQFAVGETHFIRYGLIAIMLFYFVFRGQAWAKTEVS